MSTAHQAVPVGGAEAKPMEKIEDYNELNKLERTEGREILVLYAPLRRASGTEFWPEAFAANLVHRVTEAGEPRKWLAGRQPETVIDGEWHVVGKADSEGNVIYMRRP